MIQFVQQEASLCLLLPILWRVVVAAVLATGSEPLGRDRLDTGCFLIGRLRLGAVHDHGDVGSSKVASFWKGKRRVALKKKGVESLGGNCFERSSNCPISNPAIKGDINHGLPLPYHFQIPVYKLEGLLFDG